MIFSESTAPAIQPQQEMFQCKQDDPTNPSEISIHTINSSRRSQATKRQQQRNVTNIAKLSFEESCHSGLSTNGTQSTEATTCSLDGQEDEDASVASHGTSGSLGSAGWGDDLFTNQKGGFHFSLPVSSKQQENKKLKQKGAFLRKNKPLVKFVLPQANKSRGISKKKPTLSSGPVDIGPNANTNVPNSEEDQFRHFMMMRLVATENQLSLARKQEENSETLQQEEESGKIKSLVSKAKQLREWLQWMDENVKKAGQSESTLVNANIKADLPDLFPRRSQLTWSRSFEGTKPKRRARSPAKSPTKDNHTSSSILPERPAHRPKRGQLTWSRSFDEISPTKPKRRTRSPAKSSTKSKTISASSTAFVAFEKADCQQVSPQRPRKWSTSPTKSPSRTRKESMVASTSSTMTDTTKSAAKSPSISPKKASSSKKLHKSPTRSNRKLPTNTSSPIKATLRKVQSDVGLSSFPSSSQLSPRTLSPRQQMLRKVQSDLGATKKPSSSPKRRIRKESSLPEVQQRQQSTKTLTCSNRTKRTSSSKLIRSNTSVMYK